MKRSRMTLAAALALLVGAAALWLPDWLASPEVTPQQDDRTNEAPIDAAPPSLLEGNPVEASTPIAARSLPDPVDLEAADRERDIHGVVLRRDGTPVPGASLQVVDFPWRRGRVLGPPALFHSARTGPSSRSAEDGTFSLRCRPGFSGDLRVEAEGLARVFVSNVQAGQRLRVVLPPAARLRIRVHAPDGSPAAGTDVRLFRAGNREGLNVQRRGTSDAKGELTFEHLPQGIAAVASFTHAAHGSSPWVDIRIGADDEVLEHTFPKGRTLRGRVTDAETGDPIAGARVGMNWVAEPFVLTDDDGSYELPGWTGRNVALIAVHADGYAHADRGVGTARRIDFALTRGTRVTGRVVHAGRPVGGVRIAAVAARYTGTRRVSHATTQSDADGRFELTGMAPDLAHALVLIATGYGRTIHDIDADSADRDLGDVEIKPSRRIAGVVLEADGQPRRGVLVEVSGANPDRAARRESRMPAQTTHGLREMRFTDDLGRFHFTDLAAGPYELSVQPTGGRGVRQQVELPGGRDVTDLEIRLGAARPIRVRVRDHEGKPVPGAFVTTYGRAGGGGKTTTDGDGLATLQIRPDVDTVRVMVLGGGRSWVDPLPRRIAPDDDEIVFTLTPAVPTRGRIVDPAGKGVAGAEIAVVGATGGNRTIRADQEGRFEIKLGARDAPALIFEGKVGANTFVPLEGRLTRITSGASDIVLRTKPVPHDRTLRVRLLDPEGRPVPNAAVRIRPALSSSMPRTDAEGWVSLTGLLARPLEVRAFVVQPPTSDWIAPDSQEVTPNGQTLTLRVRRGLRLDGTVMDEHGAPVSGVSVRLSRGGTLRFTRGTKDDGTFSLPIDPLADGVLEIEALTYIERSLHRAVLRNVDPYVGRITLRLNPVK